MSTSSDRRSGSGSSGSATGARTWRATSHRVPGCELAWCCDLDEANRARFAPQFPTRAVHRPARRPAGRRRRSTRSWSPPAPRRTIRSARRCSTAGKHLFVEKPLALTVEHAADLVALAARHDRQLMVGHLLRFHPAFVEGQGAGRGGRRSGGCCTCTRTGRTSARCARTRTRSGASRRTTCRWRSRCRPSGPARCRRAASATCSPASRTSSSATSGSRPARWRTCTSRGSTRTSGGC